jgi:hypothetical protein
VTRKFFGELLNDQGFSCPVFVSNEFKYHPVLFRFGHYFFESALLLAVFFNVSNGEDACLRVDVQSAIEISLIVGKTFEVIDQSVEGLFVGGLEQDLVRQVLIIWVILTIKEVITNEIFIILLFFFSWNVILFL